MSFNMAQLPDVCLQHILQYLTLEEQLRCVEVCERWRNLIENHILRIRTEIKLLPSSVSSESPDWMKYLVTPAGFHHVMRCCGPSLTSLDLTAAGEFLNLEELRFVDVIRSCCTQLKSLKLSTDMTEQDFGRLTAHLGSDLQTLELTEYFDRCITPATVATLFECCKNLENLSIPGSLQLTSVPCRNSPRLKTLDISRCRNLQDDFLEFLEKGCRESLVSLKADGCITFTLECLKTISNFSNLKVLWLCGFDRNWPEPGINVGYSNLSNLKHLEKLRLEEAASMNDDEFTEILTGCRKLRVLNIYGAGWTGSSLSSGAFAALQYACNLESLNVSGQQEFDDESLVIVGKLPRLTHLYLSECPKITCEGLKEMAPLARKLQVLDLYDNKQIKSVRLLEVFDECHDEERKIKICLTGSGLGHYLRYEVSSDERPMYDNVEYDLTANSSLTHWLGTACEQKFLANVLYL